MGPADDPALTAQRTRGKRGPHTNADKVFPGGRQLRMVKLYTVLHPGLGSALARLLRLLSRGARTEL